MILKRKLFAAGVGVLALAVVGHLTQRDTGPVERAVLTDAPPKTDLAGPKVARLPDRAAADQLRLPRTPPLSKAPAITVDAAGLASPDLSLLQPRRFSPFGLPCKTELSLRPQNAGIVALTLTANCALDQPIVVRHAGLRFSDRLNAQGVYRARVPALRRDADFDVTLADGETVRASVHVPDAARYRRVVLQWQGRNDMQLHAREFGAEYGARGHVWAGAPGSATLADHGRGGFLSLLGRAEAGDGAFAQIYSFPRGIQRSQGVVRVSIEAEVTPENCGRQLGAETLQPGLTGLQAAGLRFDMPDCGAVGDILVLKNVLRDLKIAQN